MALTRAKLAPVRDRVAATSTDVSIAIRIEWDTAVFSQANRFTAYRVYNRGSTGSLSIANTAKTHS